MSDDRPQSGGSYTKDKSGKLIQTRSSSTPHSAATVEVPVEAEAPPEETEAETTDDEE